MPKTSEKANISTSERGQKKRSIEELREAFAKAKDALQLEGLSLQVEDSGRCTLFHVQGDDVRTVYGPVAGNTFIRALEGAKILAPYAGNE